MGSRRQVNKGKTLVVLMNIGVNKCDAILFHASIVDRGARREREVRTTGASKVTQSGKDAEARGTATTLGFTTPTRPNKAPTCPVNAPAPSNSGTLGNEWERCCKDPLENLQ